jgi:hypothetical protein
MNETERAANPIGTEMIFEDDRVRIWTIDLAPGEEAPFHTHLLDYTTVTIEGDMVERINADGSRDRIAAQPGAVSRWYQSTQPAVPQRDRRGEVAAGRLRGEISRLVRPCCPP